MCGLDKGQMCHQLFPLQHDPNLQILLQVLTTGRWHGSTSLPEEAFPLQRHAKPYLAEALLATARWQTLPSR